MGVESSTAMVVSGLERILGSPMNSPEVRKLVQTSREKIYFSALQAAKTTLKDKSPDIIVREELKKAKARLKPTTDYIPFAQALRGIFGAAIGEVDEKSGEDEKKHASGLFHDLGDYVADDCMKIVEELTARQKEYQQFYGALKQASPNMFDDRTRKEAIENAISRVGNILGWFRGVLDITGREPASTEEKEEAQAATPEGIDLKRFYSASQAAELLGITVQGVRQRLRRHEKDLSESGVIRKPKAYTGGKLWEIRGDYIEDLLKSRSGATEEAQDAEPTSKTEEAQAIIKIDPERYYTPNELGEMLDANVRTINKWYQNNLTEQERADARRHVRGAKGRAFEIQGRYILKMLPEDQRANVTLEEIAATADTSASAEEGKEHDYTITEAAAKLGVVESALWSALRLHKKDLTKSGALYSTGKAGPQHLRVTREYVEGLMRDKVERKSKTYRWGVDETDHETYYTMQEAAKILGIGESGLMGSLRRHAEQLAPKRIVRRGKAMARGKTWEVKKSYIEQVLKQKKDSGIGRYRWDRATEEMPATAAGQISVDPARYYTIRELGELLGVTKEAIRIRVKPHESALKRKGAIRYALIERHNTVQIRGDALPKILADPSRIRLEKIVEEAAGTATPESLAQDIEGHIKIDPDRYYTPNEVGQMFGVTGAYINNLTRHNLSSGEKQKAIRHRKGVRGKAFEIKGEYIPKIMPSRSRGCITLEEISPTATGPDSNARAEQETTGQQTGKDPNNYYTPKEAAKILGISTGGLTDGLRRYEESLAEKGIIRRGKPCAQGKLWEVSKEYIDGLLNDRKKRELKRYQWETVIAAQEEHKEPQKIEYNIDPERYYKPTEAAKMLRITGDGLRWRLRKHEKALLESGDVRRGSVCAQGFRWEIRGSYIQAVLERVRKHKEETGEDWPAKTGPKRKDADKAPATAPTLEERAASAPAAPKIEAPSATAPKLDDRVTTIIDAKTQAVSPDTALLCVVRDIAWMHPNVYYTPLQIARTIGISEDDLLPWLHQKSLALGDANALKTLSKRLVGGTYHIPAIKADSLLMLIPQELHMTLLGKIARNEAKAEGTIIQTFTGDKPENLERDVYYSYGQISQIIGKAYCSNLSAVVSSKRKDIPDDDKTAFVKVPHGVWSSYRATLLRGQYVPLLLPRHARNILKAAEKKGEQAPDAMRKAVEAAGERFSDVGRWYNTLEAARALFSRTGRDQQEIVAALTAAAKNPEYSSRVRTHELTGSVEYHGLVVSDLERKLRPQ